VRKYCIVAAVLLTVNRAVDFSCTLAVSLTHVMQKTVELSHNLLICVVSVLCSLCFTCNSLLIPV